MRIGWSTGEREMDGSGTSDGRVSTAAIAVTIS